MPMDVHLDDLYELVDVQTQNGQEVLNVYFYRTGAAFITTFPTNAQLLATNWAAQILPDITPLQVTSLVHNRVKVRNLYDPTDAFVLEMSTPGLIIAEGDSNFDAMSFKLQGETHAVKGGAKRIGGLWDDANVGGVVTESATLSNAATLDVTLAKAVQVGLIIPSDVFFPALVKRVRSGVSGAYTYELPSVRGEGIWTNVISAVFDVLITSQVSRKIGIGA